MRMYLYLLLSLLFLHCATKKPDAKVKTSEMLVLNDDQKYIYQEFKEAYMYYCLNYGYNSRIDRSFLNNDWSLARDFPLGFNGMRIIDSLARVQMEKIKADSIFIFNELGQGDEEFRGKKRVLQICLHGYDNMADSIAYKFAKGELDKR